MMNCTYAVMVRMFFYKRKEKDIYVDFSREIIIKLTTSKRVTFWTNLQTGQKFDVRHML